MPTEGDTLAVGTRGGFAGDGMMDEMEDDWALAERLVERSPGFA